MKLYIIAGEASGDLHGSNLIKALKTSRPEAEIRCWGGDLMEKAGGILVKHYRELAFMGFVEVVKNLPTILKNIDLCKTDIRSFQPDAIVLIDYPGFNLRIAKWAKKNGFKTIYYISPQVWAWKSGRTVAMKRDLDKMIVILPFEQSYFKEKWNWDTDYVGHPLLEEITRFKETYGKNLVPLAPKPIVALLPGSRKQEIKTKLPIMLSVSQHFPDHEFVVAMAPGLESSDYAPYLVGKDNVKTIHGNTYGLLMSARAALVTSGTATLETALFGVPEVVCYKGGKLSYAIGKRLVKVKFISLVNLILEKECLKELIQDDLTEANLVRELGALLRDRQKATLLKSDYERLWATLRQDGSASAKAAGIILEAVDGEKRS